jgi:hypothetical protein
MKSKSWITKGLLVSIWHKSRLYKKYIKNPLKVINRPTHLTKNKFSNLCRSLERKHSSNLPVQAKNNTKLLWNIYGTLMKKSKTKKDYVEALQVGDSKVTIPNEIADSFNCYFSTVGPELASKIR